MTDEPYEGPAIVELMGHRSRAGHVREVEMYGTTLLRIDIPTGDGKTVTELVGGSAIYCLTPCEQAMVDDWVRRRGDLRPVSPFHYSQPALPLDDDDDEGHWPGEPDA